MMTINRRKALHLTAAALAAPALIGKASAQAWPNRVVRLVVGFPPGGGADAATRIAADKLTALWGQQVVVENRPGAGGHIANDAVAHAAPDGYTMLMSPSSLVVMPQLFPGANYDPMKDLAPISFLGTYPNLVVVPQNSPFKTLQDYLAKAKAEPGKVTFATPGIGSAPHLAAELFKKMANVDITHVPYRGVAAGAMSDLLSNRIDSMFNTTGSLLASVRAGQTRALAASTPKRFPLSPDIPTFAESGVPGFDVTSWYALFAPAKTPPEIIKKMHDDSVKVLADASVKERYEKLGVEAASSTPQELSKIMRDEVALWTPIIKVANIKGE
ncbi:MAG: tripartite tricarboxylate transporter substrate binding protein [Pseudolabrys sp.]|nr:tripartite tricarboxylate transporter substrate binding protein [Pseudolabrys sp.]